MLGAVTGAVAALVLAACSAGHPAPASIAAPTASPAGTRTASPAATPATSRATPAAAVTITAVGDMMLGNTPDLPSSPGTYFRAVKPALTHGAQIVFGNLEGTLTTATGSKCGNAASGNCFAFRNPPDYAS
jgi:hypothetical protein